MPLDKFVLILVIVIAAAGATVWLVVLLGGLFATPGWAGAALVPALLAGYVIWRVVAQRLASREDDHYDRISRK